jgi:glycosyltransferase involved in cell wall biosynthesis
MEPFPLNSTSSLCPTLAIVANCLTPYRVHLHSQLAAGIPELKLHTLVTHDDGDFKWTMELPESIHAVYFGRKGDSPTASSIRSPAYEWRKGGRIVEYLHANSVRAVICCGYRYLSYMRLIGHCHRAGIPLFVNNDSNIRSEPIHSPSSIWAKRQIYAWWLRRVQGVMPMGRLGEEFFLKYGANPRHFYRLPYTPDYEAFSSVDMNGLERFRSRYGLHRGRRYLLFSGRLVQVKRVDLLVDAFARLASERPDWDLLIVGDGPLKSELQARLPEGLRNRVIWTGFLEQRELRNAYHASEVLVLPSSCEPWAVVVQEAMSAGLPVVASHIVGAADELISDGVSGRIFPSEDLAALVDALRDVTTSDRLANMKQAARDSLSYWRKRVDPIAEVRRALTECRVLSVSVSKTGQNAIV